MQEHHELEVGGVPQLRHIEIVLDRSGSMQTVKSDTEGGLRAFLAEQDTLAVPTTVSLTQFNGEVDLVYSTVRLQEVPDFELRPGGGTALLDAIGERINRLSRQLESTPAAWRPDEIIMVILTDGQENSSSRYGLEEINQKIRRRQNRHGWRFVFLGADQDAISVGTSMGVSPNSSLSYSSDRTRDSLTSAGRMVARGTRSGHYEFTTDERGTAREDR